MIDTHAHLTDSQFALDLDAVIARAAQAGVLYIIDVGTDITSDEEVLAHAAKYPGVYAAVGIHPHEAGSCTEELWSRLRELAGHDRVVAIGETGLDFYRDHSPRDAQEIAFQRQIELACDLDLPLIVHSRRAVEAALKLLPPDSRAVFHCFDGTAEAAAKCVERGFFVSFAGPITFPTSRRLRSVAKEVPIERILLETDAPYLAPQPVRGQRNEPACARHLLPTLAQAHDLSEEDVARTTTLNAQQFFGIGQAPERGAIAYPIRRSLYLNITNRCTNNCCFCVRQFTDFVKGHNLRLSAEPSVEDIIEAIGDPGRYEEVVFCGYGEPTLRLDVMKAVGRYLKERGVTVRLVTNGQANLIHGRPVAQELRGIVDRVSVSINTADPAQYNSICRPSLSKDAFSAVLDFVRDARQTFTHVEMTAIDMPGVDIAKCRELATSLGIGFRLRRLDRVG